MVETTYPKNALGGFLTMLEKPSKVVSLVGKTSRLSKKLPTWGLGLKSWLLLFFSTPKFTLELVLLLSLDLRVDSPNVVSIFQLVADLILL